MRDNHRDAIKRQSSTRSGQAAKQTSQWKYQKVMEFLLPHMQNRKRTSNFRNDSESIRSPNHDNDTQMSAPSVTTHDQMSNDSEQNQLEDLLSDATQSTQSSGFFSNSKRRKSEDVSELLTQFQNNNLQRMKEKAELKQMLTASDDLDDLDHFFLSMSKTLKKLPNYLQLKVKRTAMNALLEAVEINEQNSWTAPRYGYFTAPTETVTSQTHENVQLSSSLNITEPPLPPPSPGADNEQL